MSKLNNPQAFPREDYQSDDGYGQSGMTLLDYFAAAALPDCSGNARDADLIEWFGKNASNITREQIIAKQAYRIAEAMLVERHRRVVDER